MFAKVGLEPAMKSTTFEEGIRRANSHIFQASRQRFCTILRVMGSFRKKRRGEVALQ